MSADLRDSEARRATHTLTVRAAFSLNDERHAQEIAADMIDRAHEIANLPDCECDVDVSVELARCEDGDGVAGGGTGDAGGARAPGSVVKH
ncbi:MAG TPA: hypothetical protein VN845_05005 [Solirubrobacteraceae bacterium]|nr:hypothetical protein [Solirubrobacteraceae bacterium]